MQEVTPHRYRKRSSGNFLDRSVVRALLLTACCSSGAALHAGDERGTCYARHTDPADPSSLGYYRALYDFLVTDNFQSSQRVGSVEAVTAGSLSEHAPVAGPEVDLSLIRISSILAFSDSTLDKDGNAMLVPRGNGGAQTYGDAAGFLLGVHHFNNGIGSVVRDVEGINETCPVRFVVDYADSESSQSVAVENFSRDICENDDRPPAALFSAWRSAVSIPLAILSGVYQIPQISPLSTSTELDDATQYRSFARLIPSDAGTARAAIDYLRGRSPGLRSIGVLYVNDAYGSAFNQALAESAQSLPEGQRIAVKGSPFSYNVMSYAALDSDRIRTAVRELADSKLRVFFGLFYDVHFELVMRTAFEFGIVGPGYTWIVGDGLSESYLQGRSYPAGSPLAVASQGIGILKAEGGRETTDGSTGYDRFSRAWYQQSDESVDYYNCVGHPLDNTAGDPSIYYQGEPGIFSREEGGIAPSAGSVFVYDSVMSLGLAACGLIKDGAEEIGGADLFSAFLEQEFEGASGHVVVDRETHSRDPSSAFFVLYNINGETNGGVTTFSVSTVSHTIIGPEAEGGTGIAWVDVNGTSFVYSDGTTTFPSPQGDLNLIPTGLKIAGYALFAVSALVIFGCAVWLYIQRKTRQVANRQLPLLGLVLLGCLISTSTILALAQESAGDGPVPACMVTPWLYSVGFCLTFATLLAKSWRIMKLFNSAARMQRTAVTVKHALLIVGGILILDIIILAVWTGVDPLRWTRQILLSDTYGDPASQGYCTSDHFVVFVSCLAALHFSILAAGTYFCYVSRAVPTQFSEGKFVSLAILSNLQVYLIGLPVLLIVGNDADGSFFVRTGIIWINNMTVVGFVFGNLIYAVHMDTAVVISTQAAIKSFVEHSHHPSNLYPVTSAVGSRRNSDYSDSNRDAVCRTTELIMAASKGDLDKVRSLLTESADIIGSNNVVVRSLASINAGDYDHRTALHLAAGEGHAQVVQELCTRGANVNAEDRWGGRPLDDAIRCEFLECAEILIRYGAKTGQRHSKRSLPTSRLSIGSGVDSGNGSNEKSLEYESEDHGIDSIESWERALSSVPEPPTEKDDDFRDSSTGTSMTALDSIEHH